MRNLFSGALFKQPLSVNFFCTLSVQHNRYITLFVQPNRYRTVRVQHNLYITVLYNILYPTDDLYFVIVFIVKKIY